MTHRDWDLVPIISRIASLCIAFSSRFRGCLPNGHNEERALKEAEADPHSRFLDSVRY